MSMQSKKVTKQKKPKGTSAITKPTRAIKPLERLLLFVRAGGSCEFDGCNEYLLEHHLTLTEGNFAQMAHVVAFSADGPRGDGTRPKDINGVDNLMLLCPRCHKLIDDAPDDFTRETLVGYKNRHEERIRHVCSLGPDQKTSIVILKSKIGEQTVAVPFDQILQAITPRYPISKGGLTIDLTQLVANKDSFVGAACDVIREQIGILLSSGGEARKSDHISLFALAPIPILVFLGSRLSNKVPLDLFQRHRDTEGWLWKSPGSPALYGFRKIRDGKVGGGVALQIALSGPIDCSTHPSDIKTDFSIYELTLEGQVPNPTFLRTKQDLDGFRIQYQIAIATIMRDHPHLGELHLLAAVPAPIAVLCGRELLPKVHPALRVYDNVKERGGFIYQLTINN